MLYLFLTQLRLVNDFPKNMTFQRFNDLRKPKFRHLIYMHMARGVWKSRKKVEEQKELVEQSRKLTKFLISHFAVRLLHAKKKATKEIQKLAAVRKHTHICMWGGHLRWCWCVCVCVCRPSRGAIKNSKLSLTFGFGQKITYSINITQASNARTQLATLVILSART